MRLIGLTVALTLSLVFSPLATEARQSGRVWRIGFLSPYSADYDKTWRVAFKHGLRDLYVDRIFKGAKPLISLSSSRPSSS